MASKFKSNGTDLDDIFTPRDWFKLGNTIFAWGGNNGGWLGTGDSFDRSSPAQIGGATGWKNLVSGFQHTLAVKNDGSLWSWGFAGSGSLGLNSTAISRSSPTQVGSLTNWKSIATSASSSFSIKTDGSLWAWGENGSDGTLGLNTSINVSSPIQVGTDTDWKIVSIGVSRVQAALKTDNTLWTWGYNRYGTLGQNDTISKSSPVQIGITTDWYQISAGSLHMLAIKSNGTLWVWGGQFATGQLGLEDSIIRSSPTQIGLSSNWSLASAGNDHSLAITNSGELWSWGNATQGESGRNSVLQASSPTQVGSLTDWYYVLAGADRSFAIKTNGSLWSWGRHNNGFFESGMLGLGDTISRSSPVQVGSKLNWRHITGNTRHTVALLNVTDINA
jgi:alpha-tubulin suppressor-like RCC1 family protein